jgi:hypothetical protein
LKPIKKQRYCAGLLKESRTGDSSFFWGHLFVVIAKSSGQQMSKVWAKKIGNKFANFFFAAAACNFSRSFCSILQGCQICLGTAYENEKKKFQCPMTTTYIYTKES